MKKIAKPSSQLQATLCVTSALGRFGIFIKQAFGLAKVVYLLRHAYICCVRLRDYWQYSSKTLISTIRDFDSSVTFLKLQRFLSLRIELMCDYLESIKNISIYLIAYLNFSKGHQQWPYSSMSFSSQPFVQLLVVVEFSFFLHRFH